MSQIEVRGITKIFGTAPKSIVPMVQAGKGKDEILAETGHTVGLNNVSLTIEKGEIFVIMGLSGSGKSTLIRHFNRLIEPTAGSIVVDGVDVVDLDAKALERFRRTKMSMVFQRFGLFPHRTVIENTAYGLEVQGVDKPARYAKAKEWLETVGLSGYEDSYPSQLSGGMQQRVGLARALCTDPEILLMDEAFSALDPLIRSGMQDQLIELQEKLNKTIVFITHDLDEALRIGDKIAILKDGVLSQVGRPEEILLHPADDYVEAFVRDVNRARVLTAEIVMRPPEMRITAETMEGALKQMRGKDQDFGYVFKQEEFAGIVTAEALEDAIGDDTKTDDIYELAEDTPTVLPDAALQDVLPATLETEYPVPVVDDEGDFKGVVSRESMAEVLASNDDATDDDETPAPRNAAQ